MWSLIIFLSQRWMDPVLSSRSAVLKTSVEGAPGFAPQLHGDSNVPIVLLPRPHPSPPGTDVPLYPPACIRVAFTLMVQVAAEGRALVVAANKSDISGVPPGEYAKGVIDQVEALMPDVRAPPVLSVCALNGKCWRWHRGHASVLPTVLCSDIAASLT